MAAARIPPGRALFAMSGYGGGSTGGIQYGVLDRTALPEAPEQQPNAASNAPDSVADELELAAIEAEWENENLSLADLRRQNFEFKMRIYHLEQDLKNGQSKRMKELVALTTDLQRHLKEVMAENEGNKKLCLDSLAAIDRLKADVTAARSRVDDAERRAGEADAARDTAERRIVSLVREHDDALRAQQKAAAVANERAAAAEAEVARQREAFNATRDKTETALQLQLREALNLNSTLEQRCRTLVQQHEQATLQLTAQHNALKQQSEGLAKQYESLRQQYENMKQQYESLKARYEVALQNDAKHEAVLNEHKVMYEALVKELQAKQAALAKAENEHRDHLTTIEALRAQLQQSQLRESRDDKRPSTSSGEASAVLLARAERAEAEVATLRAAAEAHLATTQTLREKMQRLTVMFERRLAATREEMEQAHAARVAELEAVLVSTSGGKKDEENEDKLAADALSARNRLLIAALNHLYAALSPGGGHTPRVPVGTAERSSKDLAPADLNDNETFRAVERHLLDGLRDLSMIHARFQEGVTRLDRALVAQYREAEARVGRIEGTVAQLQRSLAAAVAARRESEDAASHAAAEERLRADLEVARASLARETRRMSECESQLARAEEAKADAIALVEAYKRRLAAFQRRVAPALRVVMSGQYRAADRDAAADYIMKQIGFLATPLHGNENAEPQQHQEGVSGHTHDAEKARLERLLASRDKMLQLVLSKAEELVERGLLRRDFLDNVVSQQQQQQQRQ